LSREVDATLQGLKGEGFNVDFINYETIIGLPAAKI